MAVNEQSELNKFLEENRRKGYIVPSKSPMSSPVFFIKKKDGKLRLIQDYRKLNKITIKNRYPLPLAADVINQLRGAKYFTKFDVRWGYNNVRIKKGDEWKAAFATNRGLFEPTVMFFGLTNSPATFQSLMNAIFADLVAGQKVIVYLDDILIYSTDLEEHRKVVCEVLKRLQDHDLYLRPEKCEFEQTKVEYLGMVISEGKVEMDPSKVEAITSWPTPNTLRELWGFIGFANLYRRFIQNFSRICRPLHDLTKQGQIWHWGPDQDKAFWELKKQFSTAPVLAQWNPDRPTRLEVDASGYATGGELSQRQEDGKWHPVAYCSESMGPAERNYKIWDREMLAIIWALEDWRHFLEGLPESFEICTDHHNLVWWTTTQDLSRRQARWALRLSRFNFKITPKPGSSMGKADALSRRSDHSTKDGNDNKAQTVLKEHHLPLLAGREVFALVKEGTGLEERIQKSSHQEAEVLEVSQF
jgi:hypothetical protein